MNTDTKKVIYGLTAHTVATYSQMVGYGYSWATAMKNLKSLYEHNKNFANSLK
ncbi:hypothetical protein BI037_gp01 [Morganella phage vB_MmoP_MP2]|uniref:Uncharacterized protein n=1 Tax=Morganella phage vB_MmoP_MP2 TaxID=1852627 RepID=A0A192YB92_9CAUD|nr:hypothetical protein BI037_gp01 [Morganella phage vB_MmoP_MP2]ANM46390.1 hypothetical protein MP2_gp01 [Morganella phage vB_MmoP_MP2]